MNPQFSFNVELDGKFGSLTTTHSTYSFHCICMNSFKNLVTLYSIWYPREAGARQKQKAVAANQKPEAVAANQKPEAVAARQKQAANQKPEAVAARQEI